MKTRIKEFRARYDLTQELEKGKYNPSLKLAYQIAKVLKSSVEELFIFDAKEFSQSI